MHIYIGRLRYTAVFGLALVALLAWAVTRHTVPADGDVVRFAAIGDMGTGGRAQLEVASEMEAVRRTQPFDMVLMLGDNVYDSQSSPDLAGLYRRAFEEPYRPLLEDGVRFFASLGNHDVPSERDYPHFNMGGQRYYSFVRRDATFVALDTTHLDAGQLQWFADTLDQARTLWKIVFFHHPIYSSGQTHGSNLELRRQLEPIMIRHGVQVVLSGHDHVYERTTPQNGIVYFVCGAGGKLRRGNLAPQDFTAAGFDLDRSFLVAEIDGREFRFTARSRTGFVVDSGVVVAQPRS